MGTFKQFNANIIVGPLGKLDQVTKGPDGRINIPSRPNGIVIYGTNGNQLLELNRNAVEKIIKR